jgi:hypothetical protein
MLLNGTGNDLATCIRALCMVICWEAFRDRRGFGCYGILVSWRRFAMEMALLTMCRWETNLLMLHCHGILVS